MSVVQLKLSELFDAPAGSDWDRPSDSKGKRKGGKQPSSPKTPTTPTSPTTPTTPTTPLTPTTTGDRLRVAQELAAALKQEGSNSLFTEKVLERVHTASKSTSTYSRVSAVLLFNALVQEFGRSAEAHLLTLIPAILTLIGDKGPDVRKEAQDAFTAYVAFANPSSSRALCDLLLQGLKTSSPWQTKASVLKVIGELTEKGNTKYFIPDLVPVVSECMWDTKDDVADAAKATLTKIGLAAGNPDIEPFVPVLVRAIAKPSEVPECVHQLAATTFVQAVESPSLAIMVPLLVRGLRERATPIIRQSSVIIENMAKLVNEPHDAEPFLDKLIPGLENAKTNVSDPECRNVAQRAWDTLQGIKHGVKEHAAKPRKTPQVLNSAIKEILTKAGAWEESPRAESDLLFVSSTSSHLVFSLNFDEEDYTKAISPYLEWVPEASKAAIVRTIYELCAGDRAEGAGDEADDDEGEDLCKCEFSLAYGNKILLNTAKLHLKRGRRYGLCGGNDVGKSTLMRAIANGQLEGFPAPDVLRSVYVEPDIPADLADFNVIEFVYCDPQLKSKSREEVETALKSVSFTNEMLGNPVSSLSGGWRMKLALARVMLNAADILMLDEPTNHLDKYNVAWLENYLMGLKDVTSIMVSHDSGFLDKVCTDIIHFENKKLKHYRGNLSHFVKIRPEAKSYYELKTTKFSFRFPEPGYLEGVKSKGKVLVRMRNVGFTYSGTNRKILTGVNIWCSMLSRVAVIGVNGAGKSTMIKLLTGELIADEGEIERHPNVLIAYVAQHAFHHIEQHMEKTPNEYIQWRYSGGEDKEAIDKAARQFTPEEEKKMAEKVLIDGEKRQVERIMGRRQLKKSYEYEIKWVGKPHDSNTWLPRSKLEEMGFLKVVQRIDEKEAANHAAFAKPLTQQAIAKHLQDVGLEQEFSVHTQMRALSGGQKVKVVLGAAMWNNPHILILDEPTNYLDRDSLGALAGAIKEFGGGVLMVSHHSEFTEALCPETWLVADGKLVPQNQPPEFQIAEKMGWKPEEEMVDAGGNTVKVKAKKTELSRKERMARDKRRKEALARGEELSDSDLD